MTLSSPVPAAIAGLRILLAEDEMLVAMMMADMLTDLGCVVIGPAGRVAKALSLIGEAEIDGAILDVNLAGEEIYPVAETLARRGLPFVFVTGYGSGGLREPFGCVTTLQKPFQPEELKRVIEVGILNSSG